jgi:hypothetical protein
MQTYKVKVKEILEREIEITAKDEEEAKKKVEKDWEESKIVLDYTDFIEVLFEATLLQNEPDEDVDDPSRER